MGSEIALMLFDKMVWYGCTPSLDLYDELVIGLLIEMNREWEE